MAKIVQENFGEANITAIEAFAKTEVIDATNAWRAAHPLAATAHQRLQLHDCEPWSAVHGSSVGFLPVRFRVRSANNGHSAHAWNWPRADWQLWVIKMSNRTFSSA
jgi:hypothetical protein